MIVTRDMIVAAGSCDTGVATFDALFPSGSGSFEDVVKAALLADTGTGNNDNAGFMLGLKSNPRAKLLAGEAVMNAKYQAFNPMTGRYTECASLDAARLIRAEAADAYLQANIGLFPIAQEVVTTEGESIWMPLTEEQVRNGT